MRTFLILIASLASALTAGAANALTSAPLAELDLRTRGAGATLAETAVDPRPSTAGVSTDITLNTKIPLGTLMILR